MELLQRIGALLRNARGMKSFSSALGQEERELERLMDELDKEYGELVDLYQARLYERYNTQFPGNRGLR